MTADIVRRVQAVANPNRRVPENVPGDFFVDTTCIDCDACRQIAPAAFGEAADTSFVRRQPQTRDERRSALRALLACPTGSIGCMAEDDPKPVMEDFPLPVDGPVYYCGFNSPKSFGGNSYLVRHERGNWLIDAPKFVAPLVRRLESLGGISHIFLTHRDDVADAEKYADRFGAERIIHREELASQPDAEVVLEGESAQELAPGFVGLPTPGHTKGHCCLLVQGTYLFTGDHLAWDRDERRLIAFRDYCWYSWARQTTSMERLSRHVFSWVLPGHGQRIYLPPDEMARNMDRLLAWMKKTVNGRHLD
jgi:glyoxylase-like metal-dependent hydrolase (beta-lactamase superfamily II)/ferredoxin